MSDSPEYTRPIHNDEPSVELGEQPGFQGDDTQGHYTRPIHNDEDGPASYTRPIHNDEDDTEGHLSRPIHNDGEAFGFSGAVRPDPNTIS